MEPKAKTKGPLSEIGSDSEIVSALLDKDEDTFVNLANLLAYYS